MEAYEGSLLIPKPGIKKGYKYGNAKTISSTGGGLGGRAFILAENAYELIIILSEHTSAISRVSYYYVRVCTGGCHSVLGFLLG